MSSSVFLKAASKAFFGDESGPPGKAARCEGKRSAATAATSWPYFPWPSKTQKIIEPSLVVPAAASPSPADASQPGGPHAVVASWLTQPCELSLAHDATSTCLIPLRRSGLNLPHGVHGSNGSSGLGWEYCMESWAALLGYPISAPKHPSKHEKTPKFPPPMAPRLIFRSKLFDDGRPNITLARSRNFASSIGIVAAAASRRGAGVQTSFNFRGGPKALARGARMA
mmetsp:Transcript_9295/g.27869  ORF Transcript_9295/g.27869 Transcript_9295/m.27869 type:complete len:226 (-) Transcript_9295:7-684(-)